MNDWTSSISEVSNGVWKVSYVHPSGVSLEKTGTELEQIKRELLEKVAEMDIRLKEIRDRADK